MRFEVVDRKEQREGLIFKKSAYYCKAKLNFSDDEMDALAEMCRHKDYRNDIMGFLDVMQGVDPRPLLMGDIYDGARKNGGIYTRPLRGLSPEERENKVDDLRKVGLTIKERLETKLMMSSLDGQDTVEEL